MNNTNVKPKNRFYAPGFELTQGVEPALTSALCLVFCLAVAQLNLPQISLFFVLGSYLGLCMGWLLRQGSITRAKVIPAFAIVFAGAFAIITSSKASSVSLFLVTFLFATQSLVIGSLLSDFLLRFIANMNVPVRFPIHIAIVSFVPPCLSAILILSFFKAFSIQIPPDFSKNGYEICSDLFKLGFHGFLAVVPFYLSWKPLELLRLPMASLRKSEEGILAFLSLGTLVALGFLLLNPGYKLILLFSCLPVLIYLSFRFGIRGITTGILPVSFYFVTYSMVFLEMPPFSDISKEIALIIIELIFIFVCLGTFFTALLSSEREEEFEKLTQLVNLSPIGVLFKDHQGKVTFQNQKLTDILKHSFPNSSCEELSLSLSTNQSARILQEFESKLESKAASSCNQLCIQNGLQKEKPIWLQCHSAPIISRTGQVIGHIESIIDISIEKNVQQELERSHGMEKEHRQKMEKVLKMREEFISVVSHELSTPLSSLMGWIQVLGNPGIPENVKKKALTGALRSADQQNKLIKDLIGFSSLKSSFESTSTRLELRVLLNDVIDVFSKEFINKSVSLNFTHPRHSVFIEGDKGRLFDAFRHIIGNALKFSPKSTLLKIEVEHLLKTVSIRVIDLGKGIAPHFLPYVFDSFSQEDGSLTRKEGGLGLGLAIAQKVAELHGGKLHALSEGLGKGASFIVTLPTLDSAPYEEFDDLLDEALTPSQKLSGIRVMVVDDDPDCLDILSTWVESQGAEVQAFSDAMEAYIQVVGLQPHIVLSDLSMPHVDGITFIEKLCSTKHYGSDKILIAAVTAFGDESIRKEALSKGFNGYFVKPYKFSELLDWLLEMRMQLQLEGRINAPFREGASAKDTAETSEANELTN